MTALLRRAPWLLAAMLALCVPLVAAAQDGERGEFCDTHSATNGYYTVYMNEYTGITLRGVDCEEGAYGVVTGEEHPAGAGLDILENGADPFSSFNSVVSYTSSTIYWLSSGGTVGLASRGFDVAMLGHIAQVTELNETTLQAVFDTRGQSLPDSLVFTVTLEVVGTTFADSAVRVETKVEFPQPEGVQRGDNFVEVGIRYLWDLAIDTNEGKDEGPLLVGEPDGATYGQETSFSGELPPEYWSAIANDGMAGYQIVGTKSGPAEFAPTTPNRMDYVCTTRAGAADFEYATSGLVVSDQDTDCDPSATGESGIAYYFTNELVDDFTRGNPPGLNIGLGGSETVEQYISTEFVDAPDLCLSLELDATQVNGNLGIPGLQNNDIACGDALDYSGLFAPLEPATRGEQEDFDLFFDGSDVGITRTIVDGIDILGDLPIFGAARGEEEEPLDILFSFNQAHSIPPIGLVLQSDIVRFVADENGVQTEGDFERFFDGSDIGLAAAGEDLDAILFQEYVDLPMMGDRGLGGLGNLFFSTSGNLNASGVTAHDEDVVACFGYDFTLQPGGDIQSTCELFALIFDGSEVGLAANGEDVDALAYDLEANAILLSTTGNFEVDGVSGRNEDVFACVPTLDPPLGRGPIVVTPTTSCDTVAIVFDGSDYGLRNNNVFAIDLRPEPCPINGGGGGGGGGRGFCPPPLP